MATAAIVPTTIPARHLYRNLLREISYLPPAFSSTIAFVVRQRFRSHARPDDRTNKRLSRGRALLRHIRAANNGNKTSMSDLMSKGFGRAGPKRRELISKFVLAEGPQDTKSLEKTLESTTATSSSSASTSSLQRPQATGTPKHQFLDTWDRPKLLQFLKSQMNHQAKSSSSHWPGRSITSVNQNALVPKLNIWGKPLAQKVVRTKQARWWKRSAEKIMPPVGKGEWEFLQRLSDGAQESGEWSMPTRRSPAKPLRNSNVSWDWEKYATQSVAKIENRIDSRWRRYYGDASTNPFANLQKGRQTPPNRWFRREYQRTWEKTAFIEQDPKTLKNGIQWGGFKDKAVAPTGIQMMLFDGVNAKGEPVG